MILTSQLERVSSCLMSSPACFPLNVQSTPLAKEPLGPDTQTEADSRVRAVRKS